MLNTIEESVAFRPINQAYQSVFRPARLSLGLVVPIESYPVSDTPTMHRHIERVQLAEALGFSAVWLRDVPFKVPSFGDAGQNFDPFVYLGALSATTSRIGLGVASIILPLRHPAHVAKAAATADVLSNGRLLLGVASGDRPEEYPALDISFSDRGKRFRDSYAYIRQVGENAPRFDNPLGQVAGGMEMLPRPVGGRLPLLITGASQQSAEWVASHGDGWMTYPRPAQLQSQMIDQFNTKAKQAGEPPKPVMEPLYIDLEDDANATAQPIHLGLRLGVNALRRYLTSRQAIGINHIALNLRFNSKDTEQTLRTIAAEILPTFNQEDKDK
ncbi:MAG: LLM class oxidoreductase [Burkholderiaceae bacterium]